ncbi:MAG: trigger factor [Prevotella sp.]|jgi:trigger factor|nr:trigger factor [Prevotella sp.]
MKITFENPEKVNGLMTLTVEEADYKQEVEKTLKDYRKRANIPGFRPGQAPMGLIKRQIGTQVKADAINKVVGENLQKYIVDNKIKMLGQPLGAADHEPVDLDKEAPYVFKFDIAVAPEFKVELSDKDKVVYYDIKVDDKMIDDQVDMFASRNGHYEKAESYDPEQRDLLKGDLRELDDKGNTLEGGIEVESATLMPQYIKEEAQKKLFDGAKLGDIITWNPRKAYPESDVEISALLKIDKEKVAEHTGDFSYQITEISRFAKAEVNQELFDSVYGAEAGIKDEKAFREAIAKGLTAQLETDADYRFLQDVRKYAEKKVGDLQFPEALLKRMMIENNKDKGAEFVEKNFDASIQELKWHLIREQLAEANGVKVEDDDVLTAARETARAQFAQYGMNNVPEEYINNYAQEMLKKRETVDNLVERAIDRKLMEALKGVVKLTKKSISIDDFNKLWQE